MTTVALLLILGAAAAYSVMDLLRKLLTRHMSTLALLLWMTLGAVPLFGVWAWRDGMGTPGPSYSLIALGSVGLQVLANVAMIEALRRSPLSATIPFLSLTPVFTTLFAVPLLGELPSPIQSTGILVVVSGVWWLARVSSAHGKPLPILEALKSEPGVPLMISVAAMWSLAGPLDKLAMGYVPLSFHALVLNAGIAMVTLLVLLGRRRAGEALRLGRTGWLVLAMAVVGAVALGFQLAAMQQTLVALVETIKRGVNTGLALVLGAVFFQERITLPKVLACVLMVAGVALIQLSG